MKTDNFNYYLPKELIAQQPLEKRDEARLMIIDRKKATIDHAKFRDIVKFLNPTDHLVLNDTKVIPARLIAHRLTGRRLDILLVENIEDRLWHVLIDNPRALRQYEVIEFQQDVKAKVIKRHSEDGWLIEFNLDINKYIDDIGLAPLPPYIKRFDGPTELDRIRYQTIYAARPGSIAAPTAGLHLTKGLLDQLKGKGVNVHFLTLHIGIGTFKPVKKAILTEHKMQKEYFQISQQLVQQIRIAKERRERLIACGTSTVRALEQFAINLTTSPRLRPRTSGHCDIFISPPFEFRMVESLITNFHLPKGTPLILVCAFAGRDLIFKAYKEAIVRKYRFYSYGDSMIII